MIILLSGLIIFLSAFVQGATSFGFSLIALPLMGLILPIKTVVPALVAYSLFLNLTIIWKLKVKPQVKELLLLALFAILFIPLGVQLLIFVDERVLKVSIGILLIAIAFAMKKGFKISLKNKKVAYIIAGILSGTLNGAVSLSGPPIVVLLANDNKNKNEFRSSLTFLFVVFNVFTIALYVKNQLFVFDDLINVLILLPFLFIGSLLGIFFGNKIDEIKFKKIVLDLLIIMGIINLF